MTRGTIGANLDAVRPRGDLGPPGHAVGDVPNDARVTVSLVTFNGVRWLDACLASILEQEHSNIELLLIDNGSTDGTAELLQLFADEHPGTVLILLPQEPWVLGGHNLAIAMSTGSFVCLLNQDVVLDPAFLAEVLAGFKEMPEAGSIQGRVLRLTLESARRRPLTRPALSWRGVAAS